MPTVKRPGRCFEALDFALGLVPIVHATGTEHLVLAVVLGHLRMEPGGRMLANGGLAWPSVLTIMRETDLSRQTVIEALKLLDQRGLLEKRPKPSWQKPMVRSQHYACPPMEAWIKAGKPRDTAGFAKSIEGHVVDGPKRKRSHHGLKGRPVQRAHPQRSKGRTPTGLKGGPEQVEGTGPGNMPSSSMKMPAARASSDPRTSTTEDGGTVLALPSLPGQARRRVALYLNKRWDEVMGEPGRPNVEALTKKLSRESATVEELESAVERFVLRASAGDIGRDAPAWVLFLRHLPALLASVRNAPTKVTAERKVVAKRKVYTREEREAIVASYD